MSPKFAVGEDVILQSVDLPERNGEYSVIEIYMPGHIEIDGFPYRITNVTYRLDGADEPNSSALHNGPTVWNESALRKKHTPGDMSYQELLSSVVAHKLITHQT